MPAINTMAESLFHLALGLEPPAAVIALLPVGLPPASKVNQPHVIGLIEHQTEGIIGAHFIALNPLDASVRVTGDDRKWSKGNVNGGAVRLFPAGPALAMAEGHRGCVDLHRGDRNPGMGRDLGRRHAQLRAATRRHDTDDLALGGSDQNQAGQRAVADAAPRLAALGYKIAIVRPKTGKDLNDALLALGPGADLFAIEEYEPNRAGDWYGRCTPGDNGRPMSNFSNALLALREDPAWRGVIGFDEMAALDVLRPLPGKADGGEYPRRVTDLDISHAQEWLQWAGLPWIGREATHSGPMAVARENPYHPVRQYLGRSRLGRHRPPRCMARRLPGRGKDRIFRWQSARCF